MTTPMTSPRDALAQRIRHLLTAYQAVREVRMFGGLSFMVNDRLAVAAGRDGDLLVRTNPADYDDLLGRGAIPAQMGPDRPMGRGWANVPAERIRDDADLMSWITIGIDSRAAPN